MYILFLSNATAKDLPKENENMIYNSFTENYPNVGEMTFKIWHIHAMEY